MGRLRVVDPDPVLFLISWLHENLPPGVSIGDDRVGEALPAVAVRGDGGSETRMWTGTASLGINVWDATDKAAQDLALEVRSWVEYATQAADCVEAACSLPIEVNDSSRDARRYMTAQITLTQRLA